MRPRSVVMALAGALLGTGLAVGAVFALAEFGGPPQVVDRVAAAELDPAGQAGGDDQAGRAGARPGRGDDAPGGAGATAVPTPAPDPSSGQGPQPLAAAGTEAPAGVQAPGGGGAPLAAPNGLAAAAGQESAGRTAGADELRARLAALLADPALEGARVALFVTDGRERVVFDHAADELLLPASTVKLVTAAAALARLGPDFAFTTEVRATTVPDAAGVLHGDLVLVGGGDPALASPTFADEVMRERPRTPIEGLADQVVAAGVRRVTGRVLGDPSVLPHEPVAAGWLDRYLKRGDATRSSGLTAEAGRRLFVTDGRLQSAPADDPAAEAAATLTVLLAERGVVIDRLPLATRRPPAAPHALAAVDSPPLRTLLAYTVQRSDNHLADGIFRAIGGAAGDGSWAGAGRATVDALRPLRLDWDGAVLADGSGLSRDDRLSARLLATLDARMRASNRAGEWGELMAVAGRSGTLRRRLVGTVAEARLSGKTGTLRDARALSGTVEGPDGTRYHFALLSDGLAGDATAAARALQDEVVLALAEDLYGCVRVPVAEDAGAQEGAAPAADAGVDGEPVTELRCAA